jgi:glyoxylase-like metal-dependent hydrolase (beta-lactamase superfamily II)
MKLQKIKLGFVNVFLLGEKDYILIDTGMKNSTKKLLSYFRKHNIQLNQIKLIVLTHAHEDHIGGLNELQQLTGAKVLMHQAEYDCATLKKKAQITPLSWLTKLIFFLTRNIEPKPIDIIPDIIIEETFDLTPYGSKASIIHTPGHTEGSLSIIFDQEAIIGDSIMAFFSWQKPKKPILAYDLEIIKESMKKLLEMNIKTFHCSHGKSYSDQQIKETLRNF